MITVNGNRWWQLAEAGDFVPTAGARWDHAKRVLRLRSWRALTGFPADRDLARTAARRPRAARDPWGTWARIADDGRSLVAGGADLPLPGGIGLAAITIVPGPGDDPWSVSSQLLADERVTDCTWGDDGVLFCTVVGPAGGRVLLVDRRRRWRPLSVAAPAFAADRCAAHPEGGVWLLDRVARRLGRLVGLPLTERGLPRNDAELGRLIAEDRDPPRLITYPHALAAGECVDLAVDHAGRALVLLWPAGGDAQVQAVDARGGAQPASTLRGAGAPIALTSAGDGRILVLGVGRDEAVAFTPDDLAVDADGERYPIPDWDGAPFVRGAEPTIGASAPRQIAGEAPRPLWWPQEVHALLRQTCADRALVPLARPLDSGVAGNAWQRMNLEVALPVGCALIVHAAASDEPTPPIAGWSPHALLGESAQAGDGPRGAWLRHASDAPFHRGLLCGRRIPGQSGLFTVLLQHAGRRVRTLLGRFLHLRLELVGDGVRSPELAALRVHGPRFSYRDRYLPEHYHETLVGPDADAAGPATGADFLDRLLANVEGLLTPIEADIANSHLLHDPRATPSAWLDWLAGWLGLTLDSALDEGRRRECIAHAMRLYRRRGTFAGLALALDLASGGQVRQGGIVVVEDFRLRRTFATILGADLDDEDDPLTQGLTVSGNSFVGDTLFVGEDGPELQRELLALFRADHLDCGDTVAVREFYDRLANRITVLIHADLDEDQQRLVRRVVERETPAHLGRRVLTASSGLRVGLTALVEVDTWLRTRDPRQPVALDATTVGLDGFVTDLPTLDPRMDA